MLIDIGELLQDFAHITDDIHVFIWMNIQLFRQSPAYSH